MSDGPIPVLLTAEEAGERRRQDRRAPRRTFDPLFAATLVNQIAPAETILVNGYARSRALRTGIAFNVSA